MLLLTTQVNYELITDTGLDTGIFLHCNNSLVCPVLRKSQESLNWIKGCLKTTMQWILNATPLLLHLYQLSNVYFRPPEEPMHEKRKMTLFLSTSMKLKPYIVWFLLNCDIFKTLYLGQLFLGRPVGLIWLCCSVPYKIVARYIYRLKVPNRSIASFKWCATPEGCELSTH